MTSPNYHLWDDSGLTVDVSSAFPDMNPNNLPKEITALVNAELEAGEHVTWTGQPMASRFARRNIGMVLFGIPWTAFILFWIAGASGFKVPDFSHPVALAPLFGLPFLLIGFWMLSSPYWEFCRARRTAYVITNRRALILDAGYWRSMTIRSFWPDRLKDLRRVQNADGSGDLILDRTWTTTPKGGSRSTDHGFLAIRDVKSVEMLVRQLARVEKAL